MTGEVTRNCDIEECIDPECHGNPFRQGYSQAFPGPKTVLSQALDGIAQTLADGWDDGHCTAAIYGKMLRRALELCLKDYTKDVARVLNTIVLGATPQTYIDRAREELVGETKSV